MFLMVFSSIPTWAGTYLHVSDGLNDIKQDPYPSIWKQGEHTVYFTQRANQGLVASPMGEYKVQRRAKAGQRLDRDNPWVDGQYTTRLKSPAHSTQHCWTGMHQYISSNPKLCRDHSWWGPATICFKDKQASLAISSRVIDGKTCSITRTRDTIKSSFHRVVGLGFVKSSGQGFIKTQSNAQTRVRVAWDYSKVISDAYVSLYVKNQGGEKTLIGKYGLKGAYEHESGNGTVFDIITEVIKPQQGVIHHDRVRADLREHNYPVHRVPALPAAHMSMQETMPTH